MNEAPHLTAHLAYISHPQDRQCKYIPYCSGKCLSAIAFICFSFEVAALALKV